MTSALPFDDFRNLLDKLPAADAAARARVEALFAKAAKPAHSLGRIEDIAAWLAGWTGRAPPVVTRPLVAVFAGNHGATRHGISPRPVAATAEAVELCAAGGAAVNQACVAYDLGLKVFDLALHVPTADIAEDAALDERGCAATMAFGMKAIAGGADLLCLGDLGVGNSTLATALCVALFGGTGADWFGPGSGADEAMRARKAGVVDAALTLHGPHLDNPLEALRRVGGREFAAIAGVVLLGQTGIGQPASATDWPLAAIAAVVVGGVPLSGGVGNVGGAVLGTLLLGVVANALNLLGISPYWQPAVTGAVILVAVGFDSYQRKRRELR